MLSSPPCFLHFAGLFSDSLSLFLKINHYNHLLLPYQVNSVSESKSASWTVISDRSVTNRRFINWKKASTATILIMSSSFKSFFKQNGDTLDDSRFFHENVLLFLVLHYNVFTVFWWFIDQTISEKMNWYILMDNEDNSCSPIIRDFLKEQCVRFSQNLCWTHSEIKLINIIWKGYSDDFILK